jgi:predicted alpha/beta superfamily hydrolase
MKRIFPLAILSLFLYQCEPKKTVEPPVDEDTRIVLGQKDILYSEVLEEDREIWVHLPESATDQTSSSTRYPVLYLLDGNAHFYSVSGMIRQLSTTNGNTVTPEMIVIGIPNTDRTRDLTPTHVKEVFGDTLFPKTSGGGKNFLKFIETELMPYVEKHYPTAPYRTLVGHSLGGLMVINTLVDRPELFNNYVAIDPSLWWDDQELLKRAKTALKGPSFKGKALYMGVANTMEEGMRFEEVEKDTSERSEHIRSILEFAKSTDSAAGSGLHFKWKYYDNDTHGSVPLITEYDALRFLFPWYELKGLDSFFEPNSTATKEELMDLIESHYKKVSDHFGYEVLPPESFINGLGYAFLDDPDTHDKSEALFSMNVKNFPESSNVYDSMGDCYLAQKDSLKALEFFTKALEVGENDFSQEKIDMLKTSLNIE